MSSLNKLRLVSASKFPGVKIISIDCIWILCGVRISSRCFIPFTSTSWITFLIVFSLQWVPQFRIPCRVLILHVTRSTVDFAFHSMSDRIYSFASQVILSTSAFPTLLAHYCHRILFIWLAAVSELLPVYAAVIWENSKEIQISKIELRTY